MSELTTKEAMLERAVAALEKLKTLMNIINPVGVVQAFAGDTAPDGWLLCDGSAVSRTDYADLYSVIGDTYGSGDGSTTFNLPNLVDKFVEGSATSGTEKSAGLPNITSTSPTGGDGINVWTAGGLVQQRGAITSEDAGYRPASGNMGHFLVLNFDASKSNSIYGNSTTVQPQALTMMYIIKY